MNVDKSAVVDDIRQCIEDIVCIQLCNAPEPECDAHRSRCFAGFRMQSERIYERVVKPLLENRCE